jgi:hypothetical protein
MSQFTSFSKLSKFCFYCFPRLCAWLLCSGLLAEFSALAQTSPPAGQPQTTLPHVQLQAGMFRIDAQVASTDLQREIGLMFRTQMPEHEGMLFVFESPSAQCFWMKNTLIPLSAAFIDSDGTIANIEEMKAQTTNAHCSARQVQFVLEMNKGWFAKKGLKAGSKLSGAPFNSK